MAGEMLADENSPMMMTVAQYNDRVAHTWKLATEAEQERIITIIKEEYGATMEGYSGSDWIISLIEGKN